MRVRRATSSTSIVTAFRSGPDSPGGATTTARRRSSIPGGPAASSARAYGEQPTATSTMPADAHPVRLDNVTMMPTLGRIFHSDASRHIDWGCGIQIALFKIVVSPIWNLQSVIWNPRQGRNSRSAVFSPDLTVTDFSS